jgi:hypothetical protein
LQKALLNARRLKMKTLKIQEQTKTKGKLSACLLKLRTKPDVVVPAVAKAEDVHLVLVVEADNAVAHRVVVADPAGPGGDEDVRRETWEGFRYLKFKFLI